MPGQYICWDGTYVGTVHTLGWYHGGLTSVRATTSAIPVRTFGFAANLNPAPTLPAGPILGQFVNQ